MRSQLFIFPFALLVVACGTATLDMGSLDASPSDASTSTPPSPSPSPSLDGGSEASTFSDEAQQLGARWTWLDVPNPHEAMLTVAGTSLADVFYAGTHGTVKHWDGRAWSTKVLDAKLRFVHAWAPSPGALWLVAQDEDKQPHLGRYDGATWSEDKAMLGVTVQALSGTAPDLAWAVGARGEIREWKSGAWRTTRAATGRWLRAVHGFSANDVWAVGDRGQIVHYDGTAWSTAAGSDAPNPLDADYMYAGVWGATPNDVWAVGMRFASWTPVFSHFDGTRWSVVSQPTGVCGEATDSHAYARSWWQRWSNIPWNENHLDTLIPFGPLVVGTSAKEVMAITGCPFRYDGEGWKVEPPAWWKDPAGTLWSTDNYDYDPIPSPPLAALATDVLAFTYRLEPSVVSPPADGHNPRWKVFLQEEHGLGGSALSVDATGNLWSADVDVKMWTPSGWSRLDLSTAPESKQVLFWGAGESRHLVARNEKDVWAGYYSSQDNAKKGVLHWDGASWKGTDLGMLGTVLAANRAHTWAAGGNLPYALHRLDAAGTLETSATVSFSVPGQGWGGDTGEDVALLPESETGDRVYFAFVEFGALLTGTPISLSTTVVIGSWDGLQPPRLEQRSPPYATDGLEQIERLARLPDGDLAVMTRGGLWVWDSSGVSRRIEAGPQSPTCKAGSDVVKVSWADVGCELRDIAPAPRNRFWLAAGGAILLWDPATNQLAEAVENVSVRTLAAGGGGEAFGAAFLAGGYSDARSDTIHFVPPPDGTAR